MKNRTKVFAATLVALAFAFAPVLKALPRPDGGPISAATTTSVNANSGGSMTKSGAAACLKLGMNVAVAIVASPSDSAVARIQRT